MKKREVPVLVLDGIGRLKLVGEINKLEEALTELRSNKMRVGSSDEWDDLEYIEISREEKHISEKLNDLRDLLDNSIMKDDNAVSKENVIELNDVVELNLIFGEDSQELMLVRVAPVCDIKTDDDVPAISVESPLGQAIYKQEIGKTVSYKVNNVLLKAEILSIVNEDVKETESMKTK